MSVYPSELSERIRAKIRDVPDFPKPGIMFKDITPVWGCGETLSALTAGLADRFRRLEVDAVAGIESRGFVTGAPVAHALSKGFVLLRKPGKLPWRTVSQSYALEYGTDALHMHADAVKPGMRVVVVDDLLATGGTARAACELLRGQGAEVVEVAVIVELAFLGGRARLGDVPFSAVLTY